MRAGLIPSRALQERRILEERKILMAAKAAREGTGGEGRLRESASVISRGVPSGQKIVARTDACQIGVKS